MKQERMSHHLTSLSNWHKCYLYLRHLSIAKMMSLRT